MPKKTNGKYMRLKGGSRMKKWLLIVGMLMVSWLMIGCGDSFKPSVSSLYVKSNGKIRQAVVGSFEKNYYNFEEFENMVRQEVDAHNSKYGKDNIKIKQLELDDEDTLYLQLEFVDADTYEKYSEEFCYIGTVGSALDEGFPFDMDFRGPEYDVFALEKVTEDKSNPIVILQNEGVVQLEKPVKYMSNNVEILSEQMVQIMPLADDKEYAYIIF